MRTVRPMLVLLPLWISGCGSGLTFGQEFDKLKCERQYECAQGAFDLVYADVGECRAELDDASADYFQCAAEACDFDAAQARRCLRDVRGGSCDDIVNGSAWAECNPAEVYVNCDEDLLYACIGG